ncbi:hypothetical protein [Sphingobacterium faecium]
MIKILIFALSLIVVTLFGQSQYATTSSGQKVILKSDGTWEYVKSNSSSINKLFSETGDSNLKGKHPVHINRSLKAATEHIITTWAGRKSLNLDNKSIDALP